MTLDDLNLKKISKRAVELWASDNPDRPEDLLANQYVNHQEPDAKGGVSDKDLANFEALLGAYHNAFSDSKVQVLMQIAEGNLVASRFERTATHTGDFFQHASTGRQTTWTGVQIDRHEDGKIVESWGIWDKYRFLEGLGLVT